VERYYRIEPEEGNPNSVDINALVKYSPRLKNEGRAIFYQPKMATTANAIFNYFKSISSALEYLDAQGWKLFTITNDVSGSGGSTSTQIYYYLRKESN